MKIGTSHESCPPLGAHHTICHDQTIFTIINISTHRTLRHNCSWVWRKKVIKFAIFLPLGAQPQGPLGYTCLIIYEQLWVPILIKKRMVLNKLIKICSLVLKMIMNM